MRHLRLFTLFLSLAVLNADAYAQETEDTLREIPSNRFVQYGFGPIIAYRGFNNHFFEVGITSAWASHGIGGVELNFLTNFKRDDETLHGYSISKYVGFAFLEIAATGTIYTNYSESKFYLIPKSTMVIIFPLENHGLMSILVGMNYVQ